MKTAGFTGGVDKNGTALLKGDFAGYKGCYIIVSTLDCHVLLGYNDKINGLEVEAAAMDDL